MKRDTDNLVGAAVDVHRSPLHLPQRSENEISLIDIWCILSRRKFWIIVLSGVSIAIAVLTSLVLPPRYESRAVFAIGQISKDGLLEQPEILVERLRQRYRIDNPGANPEQPYMRSVAFNQRGSKQVLTIQAVGATPGQARDFVQKAADDLLVEHRQIYSEAVHAQRDRLSTLDEQLSRLSRQVDALGGHVERLKTRDPTEAALVAIERAQLVAQEPVLRKERMALQLALLPPQAEQTRLLGEPTLSERPMHPRPALYIGLGIILGLFLGIFAAFFAEFVANARREIRIRGAG